jgi:hypothetical protein
MKKVNKTNHKFNKIKISYTILGFTLGTLMTTTFANNLTNEISSVKEFICHSVNYPIIVNGKELQTDKPILNYQGSTYLPLKVIGDNLGAKIKWNSTLIRVEIGEVNNVVDKITTLTEAQNKNAQIA